MTASERIKTGGAFDPTDRHVYFLAGNIGNLSQAAAMHDYILIAINEINNERDEQFVESLIARGKKVFIDSGIFWLTNEHARAHNVSMDVALALAPEDIDGFENLWKRYIRIAERFKDTCWGYIELDQGGLENKKRTRARIEALGLRPIPVYHPLNDGWEYFDELAARYDRICFGNVVQADMPTRKRLIATAWERHRAHPDLWIHLLGYTPNELLNAFPINSGDSSSWLSAIRWSIGYIEFACNKTLGSLPGDFRYLLGSPKDGPRGREKAASMSAYGSAMLQRNWRTYIDTLRQLGAEIYPEGAAHDPNFD